MRPQDADPLHVEEDDYELGLADGRRLQGWDAALLFLAGLVVGSAISLIIAEAVYAAPRSASDPSIPVVDQGPSGAPQELTALPRATPSGTAGGAPLSGIASWYRADGLIAAAGPALRTGKWRGRVLTFTAGGRAVRVRLADWCACPGRLVDLSDDAFRQLAPLSRGLVRVTVETTSGPAPTPPATDA